MNLFYKADYEKIERRLCALCATGNEPKRVTHTPVMELVQVKFPRSKKARIRKKWAKNPRNCELRQSTWVVSSALFNRINDLTNKFQMGKVYGH